MAAPFNIYAHINFPLNKAEVVFVSIGADGTPGNLNTWVLEALGFSKNDLPSRKDLEAGHAILKGHEYSAVIFIVTVDSGLTAKNLTHNLTSALKAYEREIVNRTVWIPLMGTGAGGLEYIDSFNISFNAIININPSFLPSRITFALPDDIGDHRESLIQQTLQKSGLQTDQIPATSVGDEELNKSLKALRINNITDQGRSFFVGGFDWGGEKQRDRFLKEGIWENGKENRFQDVVDSVEVGDIIFLKSTFRRKETGGFLRLSAIGVILENEKGNALLKANWFEFKDEIELKRGAHLRNTIQQIGDDYIDDILIAVLTQYPNLLVIVEDLSKVEASFTPDTLNISELINDNLSRNRNFWWASDYARDWSGDRSHWSIKYFFPNEKPDEFKPEKGELLLVADYPYEQQRLVSLFEIIGTSGSEVETTLIYEFNHKTLIEKLKSNEILIQHGFPDIIENDITKISAIVFEEIINTTELKPKKLQEPSPLKNVLLSNSGYNSDAAFSGRDLLNIENDVRAFALLLASSEVKPPLAIALFGKWGSGKSFFMKHLEKRIKELSEFQAFLNKGEPSPLPNLVVEKGGYCKGIAHIWFNAWSYLDANLWAGLAHSLFEKLNEYITDQSKGEIEKLKVQVRLTKRLQILHSDLEHFKEKKEQLETLKNRLNETKDKKVIKYFSTRYQEEVKTFLTNNGIPEKILSELTPDAIKERIELGTNLWDYLKRNSKQLFQSVIPLMVALFLGKQLWGIANDNILPYLQSVWMNISAVVLPVLIPVIKFYKSKKGTIDKLTSFITELSTKARSDNAALEKLQKEIAEIDPIIKEVEGSIEHEYSNNADITQLAIANFVATKSNQKEYTDKLGMVSIIRKDFETLSELFHTEEQEEHSDEYKEKLKEDRRYIQEQFKEDKKLERIILYIDDLDRCADNKVLEVIQAVHLLMAFPLFNVVVGVDNRCIHNALNYQYMLRYHQFQGVDKLEERIHEIKPEEYIEKIFQIPFKLKEASSSDIENLIDHLLEHQVTDDEAQEEDDTILPLTGTEQVELQQVVDKLYNPDSLVEDQEEPEEEEQEQPIEPEGQVGSKSHDVRQFNMIEAADNLKLSKTELAYIKATAFLVGNTPRTIKRFINIYRIIRSHEQLEYEESKKNDHFLAIVFLLAVEIGKLKENARQLNELVNKDDSRELSAYIKDLPALKPIQEELSKNETIKQLLNFKGDLFKKHLPFVRRFSFGKEIKINIQNTETNQPNA